MPAAEEELPGRFRSRNVANATSAAPSAKRHAPCRLRHSENSQSVTHSQQKLPAHEELDERRGGAHRKWSESGHEVAQQIHEPFRALWLTPLRHCPNTPKCARMFSLIFASCLFNCRIVRPCSTGSRAWANVYSIHGEPKAKEANGRCGIFRCERDRVGPRRRTPISLRASRAHADPSCTSTQSSRSPLPARCSLLPVAQLKRPTTRASATSLPRPIRKARTPRPISLLPLRRVLLCSEPPPTQISRLRKPRSR